MSDEERVETIEIRKAGAVQSTNFNLCFRQRSKAETTRLPAFSILFKESHSIFQALFPKR